MRLTDFTIKALKPPPVGQITYTDDSIPGFGIRVSRGGAKTFVLVHGKKRKRVTIGRYPIVALSNARDHAKRSLAKKTLDGDQQDERYDEALELFLDARCKQKNKASTAKETKRLLNRHFTQFKDMMLQEITTKEIMGTVDRLHETPSEANHAFTAMRTFLRFCVSRRLLKHSPLEAVELPYKARSRDRVLTADELRAILIEAGNFGAYGAILKLLVLTGQREGKIAALEHSHLDFEKKLINWPAALMKNNQPHTIPLCDRATEVLEPFLKPKGLLFPSIRGKAFNNWSASKKRFDKALPLPHWVLHDFRRVFSTTLSEKLRVMPHITERLLAHTTGEVSGVGAIYNRARYIAEMREALNLWEAHVAVLPSPAR